METDYFILLLLLLPLYLLASLDTKNAFSSSLDYKNLQARLTIGLEVSLSWANKLQISVALVGEGRSLMESRYFGSGLM